MRGFTGIGGFDKQHLLNFKPLPQGQGSFLPSFVKIPVAECTSPVVLHVGGDVEAVAVCP
jgi:hypothetical protein